MNKFEKEVERLRDLNSILRKRIVLLEKYVSNIKIQKIDGLIAKELFKKQT